VAGGRPAGRIVRAVDRPSADRLSLLPQSLRYARDVDDIRSGQIVLFYLFDVSDTIDLQVISQLIGGTTAAKLAPKQATPAYIQYDKPPLSFEGDVVGLDEVDGFKPRVRLYDYGVVSIALARPFCGSWHDLVGLGQMLIESDELEQRAEAMCRTIVDRTKPALAVLRTKYVAEDYLVYIVNDLGHPQSAEQLLAERGDQIAVMLRGERQTLSEQGKGTILRHRISYLADDLVIPTWNAAFVYDTPTGAQAALEIVEFANSQLLEYRYYDERLDDELASIYARLQKPRWFDEWRASRYTRAARQVHSLFIEVNEVTDRTENALKFIGDIYAARLFWLVAERLGLAMWKADLETKLKTLDDIYRFAVEQSSMSRGQFLELTVVLILVLELILILLGVMR
jgi:hypothetical protein